MLYHHPLSQTDSRNGLSLERESERITLAQLILGRERAFLSEMEYISSTSGSVCRDVVHLTRHCRYTHISAHSHDKLCIFFLRKPAVHHVWSGPLSSTTQAKYVLYYSGWKFSIKVAKQAIRLPYTDTCKLATSAIEHTEPTKIQAHMAAEPHTRSLNVDVIPQDSEG